MTTIRVEFPKKIQVAFYPLIYVDRHRHTYLLVYKGSRYNYYLTMVTGVIELVKLGVTSETVLSELTPIKGSLTLAAKTYSASYLTKTDEAVKTLDNILNGRECLLPNWVKAPEQLTNEDRLKLKANAIPLSTICKELRLTESSCRQYLKSQGLRPEGKRWQWPKADAARIKELLAEAAEQ